MPIIYGKTLMSTASYLHESLQQFISHKDSFAVSKVCFQFWNTQYKCLDCLIRLIRGIAWIVAVRKSPVVYRVKYLTTIQDYMVMEPIQIQVYDRLHKKRRKVTLRVNSSKRDRRKTEILNLCELHPSEGCCDSNECD